MKFLTHKVFLHPNFSKKICLSNNGGHFEFFAKIAKHKNAYILKTILDRAISTTFMTHRVSLGSSHPNFQKVFVSTNTVAILNFRIFRKNCISQKCFYLENRAK